MSSYEYRVVPSPRKGEKAKGIKTPEARMAQALETRLNAMSEEGWEYVRADMIPMDERAGITSRNVTYQTVLVFRRSTDIGMFEEETDGFGSFSEGVDAVAEAKAAEDAVDAEIEAEAETDTPDSKAS